MTRNIKKNLARLGYLPTVSIWSDHKYFVYDILLSKKELIKALEFSLVIDNSEPFIDLGTGQRLDSWESIVKPIIHWDKKVAEGEARREHKKIVAWRKRAMKAENSKKARIKRKYNLI